MVGQFNLDFITFLGLSGIWVAWRHQFTGSGIALGIVAFFGGMMFHAPYLLWTSAQTGGDVKTLLLGKERASHGIASDGGWHATQLHVGRQLDGISVLGNHAPTDFEIVGEIAHVETFAVGSSIREIARLRKIYGRGRWRKRKGIARVRLHDGATLLAEVHWYEAHGIGRREFKIKRYIDGLPMKTPAKTFVVCLKNKGYEVSLELRKIYQVLPDADAAKHRQFRVIDESGDDYLYPAGYFAPIELPAPVRKAVLASV